MFSAAAWQLELLRGFLAELGALAVALNSVCTTSTCPVMRATDEWLYLCAAHQPPKECSAIDYQLHTLDNAASTLTSQQSFPSRVNIPKESARHFGNIARRIYRNFAHAYFHHREVFTQFEVLTDLLVEINIGRTRHNSVQDLWHSLGNMI